MNYKVSVSSAHAMMNEINRLFQPGRRTSLLVGQSPPPPPTPAESSHTNQNASGSNQQNTQSSNGATQPTVTASNQPTTQRTAADIQTKSAPKSDEPSGWWIANTILLTLFNGILAYVGWKQYHTMREQIEIAKTSADAATKALEHSERALRLTERAIVAFEKVDIYHWHQRGTLDTYARVYFTVKNFGRTVAHQVAITGRLEFDTELSRSLNNPAMVDEFPQSGAVTLPSGGDHPWNSRPLGAWLTTDSLLALNNGQARLRYAVRVIYQDVFGNQHEFEGVGQWNSNLRRFEILTDRTT